MAKYGVFESTNMKSTVRGAERIYDAVCATDVENGTFGYLENVDDVTYTFVKGYKAGETVVVVDQPAWSYDESKRTNQRKDKFIVEAGTTFRVRVVAERDEFAINDACVTEDTRSKLDTGVDVVIDETTGKLVVGGTTANAVMVGKVLRKRVQGAILATAANQYGYAQNMYEVKVASLA